MDFRKTKTQKLGLDFFTDFYRRSLQGFSEIRTWKITTILKTKTFETRRLVHADVMPWSAEYLVTPGTAVHSLVSTTAVPGQPRRPVPPGVTRLCLWQSLATSSGLDNDDHHFVMAPGPGPGGMDEVNIRTHKTAYLAGPDRQDKLRQKYEPRFVYLGLLTDI